MNGFIYAPKYVYKSTIQRWTLIEPNKEENRIQKHSLNIVKMFYGFFILCSLDWDTLQLCPSIWYHPFRKNTLDSDFLSLCLSRWPVMWSRGCFCKNVLCNRGDRLTRAKKVLWSGRSGVVLPKTFWRKRSMRLLKKPVVHSKKT